MGSGKRTAVVTNKRLPSSDAKQQLDQQQQQRRVFFDVQQASDAAGDWIKGVSKDLERRFGKVDLVKVDSGDEEKPGPLKELGDNMKQLSPLRVMNASVKGSISQLLKANSGKIAATAVEAGIYCAAFHHVKEGAKHHTRGRKYSGPAVRYTCDVVMPTGLYGPIFGFLVRLALPF